MSSLFDMPHYAAADHLEEHGYPALAELHRNHFASRAEDLGKFYDKFERGHKELGTMGAPKRFDNPYFDILSYSKDTSGNGTYNSFAGKQGEGYHFFNKIPEDLKNRIISELTEPKAELARELPIVPDTEFSPVKGLGGGLKSRFQSGNHTYGVRFDETPHGTHHFSFEQLTAKPDEDETGITGAGNAMETMTKVAAHFIHGLRKLKPHQVVFTAAEPSRQKLYDKMVAQLPKYAPDYELDEALPDDQDGSVRYFVKRKKLELQKGWDGGDLGGEDQEISGPEGWITEDGEYHQNQPGPYGVRHGDTLTRLGYKNVGEGIRAGLMHLASPDGSQLLGHRSDRQYTPKQLGTLKKLAAKHSLEPAITTTSNGTVTTRSLKLSKATPPHGWIDKEGKFYNNADNPKGIASHYEALKHHGFLGEQDTMDIDDAYEKAHAQGLMHVSSIMGDLHGHHPKLDYTLPMLSKLKQLGKEHGLSSVSVTTKTNGKPGTRQLKLSRHPLAKYPMIYADHLDETGYPALAEFYREHAKKAVSTKFWNLHTKGGYRSLKLLAPLKITHPDFSGAFEGSTGIVLGHRAKGYHTGTIADMPEGLTDRIREELTRKLTLAAEKAPAGGMVSNNQFYEGGKFLPRALKSIREVRNRKLAGKVKLSRQEDLSSLFHNWQLHDRYKYGEGGQPEYPPHKPKNSHNMIAADILQENPDLPSSELHEFLRNAKPGLPRLGEHGITVRTGPHKNREYGPEYRSQRNQESRPYLARRIKSLEDPSIGIHRVYFHHDPKTGTSHIIAAMQTGGNENGEYPTRAYTWHAPATKEQLQALGAKSKRMKLSRQEDLWKAMADNPEDEGIRGVLADHLEENQQPGLAEFFRDHAKPLTDRPIKGVLDRYKGFYDTYITPYNKKADLNHPSISMLRVSTDIQPHRVTLGSPEIGYWHGAPHKELAEKIKSELMSPE